MKAVLIIHEEKSHAAISSLLANKPSAWGLNLSFSLK
jgi:hypothetical protein